jgi:hypothetical protein
MARSALFLILIPLMLAAPPPAAGQATAQQEALPSDTAPSDAAASDLGAATRLRLELDPLVELYFSVRAQAARTGAAPLPGQEAAVGATRRIQESLGAWGGWGPLDAALLDKPSASELLQRFEELPEPMQRAGREVSVRDDAIALARALAEHLPVFTETLWPTRRQQLETVVERLRSSFVPEHQRALAFMMRSLRIADPTIEVPVFLVTECHPPGASTYYLGDGEPASVLGLSSLEGKGLLEETILHEATHALDIASQGQGSVFETLREQLLERGVARRDVLFQDIPHTLMFVQAEETMRRIYDPQHLGYGNATDLYERLGNTAQVERRIWPLVLDGQIETDAALRQIVDALVPPSAQPPAESN